MAKPKSTPTIKEHKRWTVQIDKIGVTTEADSFKEAMLNIEDQLGLLWKVYVDCDEKELDEGAIKLRKFLIRYADSKAENNAISKIINMARDFECCPECRYTKIESHYCPRCEGRFITPQTASFFYEYLISIYKDYCPTCRKITETASSVGACAECGNDV